MIPRLSSYGDRGQSAHLEASDEPYVFDPEVTLLEIPESFPLNSDMGYHRSTSQTSRQPHFESFLNGLYNSILEPAGHQTILLEDQVVPNYNPPPLVDVSRQEVARHRKPEQQNISRLGFLTNLHAQRLNSEIANQDPAVSETSHESPFRVNSSNNGISSRKSTLYSARQLASISFGTAMGQRRNIYPTLLIGGPNQNISSNVFGQSPSMIRVRPTRTFLRGLSFASNSRNTVFSPQDNARLRFLRLINNTTIILQEYVNLNVSRTNFSWTNIFQNLSNFSQDTSSYGSITSTIDSDDAHSYILDVQATLRTMTLPKEASNRQRLINRISYLEDLREIEDDEFECEHPEYRVPVSVSDHTLRGNESDDDNDDHCVPEADVVILDTDLLGDNVPDIDTGEVRIKRENKILDDDRVVPDIDFSNLRDHSQDNSAFDEPKIISNSPSLSLTALQTENIFQEQTNAGNQFLLNSKNGERKISLSHPHTQNNFMQRGRSRTENSSEEGPFTIIRAEAPVVASSLTEDYPISHDGAIPCVFCNSSRRTSIHSDFTGTQLSFPETRPIQLVPNQALPANYSQNFPPQNNSLESPVVSGTHSNRPGYSPQYIPFEIGSRGIHRLPRPGFFRRMTRNILRFYWTTLPYLRRSENTGTQGSFLDFVAYCEDLRHVCAHEQRELELADHCCPLSVGKREVFQENLSVNNSDSD